MFLRDFPEHLNPGRVSLELVKPGFSLMVLQCDTCDMFSPRAYICACGHDFCTSCAIPAVGDGLWIRCRICEKKSPATSMELHETFLKELIFACSCGLKGPLQQIRAHVMEDENHNFNEDKRMEEAKLQRSHLKYLERAKKLKQQKE